jgi:hypothetical protein
MYRYIHPTKRQPRGALHKIAQHEPTDQVLNIDRGYTGLNMLLFLVSLLGLDGTMFPVSTPQSVRLRVWVSQAEIREGG